MNEVNEKGRVVSLDIPLPFAQCTYVIVYVRHYRSIDLNVSSAWVIFSATHVVRDETWFYLISSFPSPGRICIQAPTCYTGRRKRR